MFSLAIGTLKVALTEESDDRSVWITGPGGSKGSGSVSDLSEPQGAAKELGSAVSDSSPQPHFC